MRTFLLGILFAGLFAQVQAEEVMSPQDIVSCGVLYTVAGDTATAAIYINLSAELPEGMIAFYAGYAHGVLDAEVNTVLAQGGYASFSHVKEALARQLVTSECPTVSI